MCAFRPIPSPWCAFRPCLPHVRIPPPSLPHVRIPPPSLPHVLIPPPSLLRVRIPPPSLPHVRIPPPSLPLVRIPPPSLPHVRIPPPSLPLVRIPPPSLPHVRIPPPSFSHVRIQGPTWGPCAPSSPCHTSRPHARVKYQNPYLLPSVSSVLTCHVTPFPPASSNPLLFRAPPLRPSPAPVLRAPSSASISEQENGAEGGNKGEGESSSGSSMEASWWKKDVTLSLLGPALGHGEVQCLDPPACSHLRISYRLWDAGTYSATLHVGCANLNFSPAFAAHFNSTYRHDLATWSLSIGWPESARSGKYIWAFFPCAPAASPPSRWIEQLASRGIREINIVGDSHQRVLALHLHWLLSGEADKRIRKGHLDFSKESRNERNETMRINFYWVDGIYRNDEFGCSHRGIYTHRNTAFPTNVSTTADVTLLEAGYWMNKWCTEPVQAMRAHLPEYLNWGLQFAAQTGKPIVLRTAPPVPNGGDHCFVGSYPGPATNLALMEINRLMRQLTAGGKVYGGGANGLGKKRADSANETGYSEADADPAEPWDDASISRAFTVDEMRQVSTVPVFDSWKIEAPRFVKS
ncbi:unnamed protein product [Closterium sp. NIES-65]|nr:unnamed protein product [Closterium sp. NIES-65]